MGSEERGSGFFANTPQTPAPPKELPTLRIEDGELSITLDGGRVVLGIGDSGIVIPLSRVGFIADTLSYIKGLFHGA